MVAALEGAAYRPRAKIQAASFRHDIRLGIGTVRASDGPDALR
jgi:hypothetical protein